MSARRKASRSKSARRRPARRAMSAAILRYAADAGVFAMMGLFAVLAGLIWFARDLPDTDRLWRGERAAQTVFLARDGSPLAASGANLGEPVRLSDLPEHVPNAVLAMEDRNFRHHIGVNPISVLRALIVNTTHGEVRQGGSTITQQLAKNVFLSSERTMKRKVQELMLALWLEYRFTKDEILTLYLNRVYFGAGAYGIDAASRYYFGKPAREASIGEAAVLAGLLKAPSRLAPTHNPVDAGHRARQVVNAMVAAGYLTDAQAADALSKPVVLANHKRFAAPYFLDYARLRTRTLLADADVDIVVKTTLDPEIQRAAARGFEAGLAASGLSEDVQAAIAIVDRNGAVRAMIGGRDYRQSQYNRAAQARRQPGSAFKPFIYLAALQGGARPSQRMVDAPVKIGQWAPDNYKSKFYGEVTLTEAMARSLNSVAIRLQEYYGRGNVRMTARRMGLEDASTLGPALALGVDVVSPIKLARAYAPFANGGYRVRLHAVSTIETVDGQTVFRETGQYEDLAASAFAIEGVNAMMRAVVEWGTGRKAKLRNVQAYGKTGTSQANRDAWFAGHADGLVAVVWVGRDNNAPMAGVTGGGAPAQIWSSVMNEVMTLRYPSQPLPVIAPLTPSANGE